MHRAERIANDFNFEVKRITNKFLSAGFPRNFIRNTIEYFNIYCLLGLLTRTERIANDFNFEVKRITNKFLSAGFPRNFIRNTIEYFNIYCLLGLLNTQGKRKF